MTSAIRNERFGSQSVEQAPVEREPINMKIVKGFLSFFTALFLLIFLLSCGDDAGEGNSGSSGQYAIEIDTPASEGTFSTVCNEIWVGGKTNYPVSEWMSVGISWQNRTATGLTEGVGQTSTSQCLGWFLGYTWYYDCNAGWWANVPLEMGENTITITAVDSNGSMLGQDMITITKPVMSYSIRGRITNVDGTGLFNMRVRHDATDRILYTDSNGNYELKCVPIGTYSVWPDSNGYYYPAYIFFSYMDWPFTPGNRTVVVSDSDVTEQDFSTEVYEVSGKVTNLSGYGFQNLDVYITGPDGPRASSRTNASGYFTFMVPNGTYTIQPSTYFSFVPSTITVEVKGSGIYDQDFSAQ